VPGKAEPDRDSGITSETYSRRLRGVARSEWVEASDGKKERRRGISQRSE
jgi:hypothetical protein